MEQLPLFLNLRGRTVVLVGEGEAADAKVAADTAAAAEPAAPVVAADGTVTFTVPYAALYEQCENLDLLVNDDLGAFSVEHILALSPNAIGGLGTAALAGLTNEQANAFTPSPMTILMPWRVLRPRT